MRILFVGYNLHTGGIQRALVNTLQLLSTNTEFTIDCLLFSTRGELVKEIPDTINVLKGNYLLGLTATPLSELMKNGKWIDKIARILLMLFVRLVGSNVYFKTLFLFQKDMKDYDVAISYFNDTPIGYFNRGGNQYVKERVSARKKIGWIHTDPIEAKFNRETILKTYAKFDLIVSVSKSGKRKLDELVPEYKDKSTVVYNPFPISKINEKAIENDPGFRKDVFNLVTVARMDNHSKRIDRIIEVASMLKKKGYRNFKWWLIGDGPDLESNRVLAQRYGVAEYIVFTGEKSNPLPFVKHADVFVMASDYEGYPMVIGEALALGTPVISTAYAAAHEQIKDGVDGMIVPANANALFEVLVMIIRDRDLLITLKSQRKTIQDSEEITLRQIRDILY